MMRDKGFGIGQSAEKVPACLVFFRCCRKLFAQTTEDDVHARQAESERHASSLDTTKPTCLQSSRHCERRKTCQDVNASMLKPGVKKPQPNVAQKN